MGLCLNDACVRRKRCESRCKGWFPSFPDLVEGCAETCFQNGRGRTPGTNPSSGCDYINNNVTDGSAVGQQYYLLNCGPGGSGNNPASVAGDKNVKIAIAVIVVIILLFLLWRFM